MDDDNIDLKSVAALLRRQLRLIALTTLLVLALALTYLLTVSPVFTATSLVMVEPGSKNLLDPAAPSNATSNTDNARVDSEVEILRSDAVALAVVKRQDLVRDPEFGPGIALADKIKRVLGFEIAAETDGPRLVREVLDRFESALNVRRRGLTYIIAVSVDARDPQRAADLANATTEAYIAGQIEAKIATSLAARDVLQTQIEEARRSIAASDDNLDAFVQSNLARIEAESGRDDISRLRTTLESVGERQLASEVQTRAAEAALAAASWGELSERLGDDALAALERQRLALERQLGEAGTEDARAPDLRAALARIEADQRARATGGVAALKAEVSDLEAAAQDVRDEIRDTLLQGELSSDILAQVYELQQEASIARSQYQNLLSRMRDLEVQAGIQIADSRVVSAALPPLQPSFPRVGLVLALALIGGGFAGVGLAFLREFYVGGITSTTQLRDVLHIDVATAIPLTHLRDDTQLSVADNVTQAPLSPYSEAIRRLRAAIDQHRPETPDGADKRGRVVMITSAVPAEGKSTTSLALARAYALAGLRTLLIDSDLRKPSLHRQLGQSPEYGFIDFLRDPAADGLTAAFCGRDPHTGLSLVLGSGRSDVPTDQLLSSETFSMLIRDARRAFDMIIIDTPPILPVVDARYMARYVDTAVMVVRFGSTGQGELRQAALFLSDAMRPDTELLTVLSHDPAGKLAYGGQGYYAQYYDQAS